MQLRVLPIFALAACQTVFCQTNPTAGWKHYCFGFLNAYPDRKEIPQAEAMEIQKGHMAHMGKMAEAGKLLVAGPFMSGASPRGVVIYNCATVAEAQANTEPDPAVVNKRLSMEFYRMHSVPGMGEPYASKAKADPNFKPTMTQFPFFILSKTDKLKTTPLPPAVGQAHFMRSLKLMGEGKIRFFGRFEDSPEKLGVYVFNKMPMDEARKLIDEDDLVKNGFASVHAIMWMAADEAVPGFK
jgi:uncharacterized protein YciI